MSAVVARPVGQQADFSQAVCIEAAPDGVTVVGDTPREGPPAPANSAAPLLYFPDGRRYAVEDTNALDTVLAEARIRQHRRQARLAHCGWKVAVALLLMAVVAATLGQRWTAPIVARILSSGISSHMLRSASERALATLDTTWLAPSELSDARQNALRARFATLRVPGAEPIAWRVLFRSGARIGPAAFLLPDGAIVLTDELVARARNENEVVAVLAHKFGHLQHDDVLTALVWRSPWLVLRSWGGGEQQAARLAQGLIDSPPEREAAKRADLFAAQMLAANGIAPSAMSLLFQMRQLPKPPGTPALLKGH